MTGRIKVRAGVTGILICVLAISTRAGQQPLLGERVGNILPRFEHQDWEARAAAFYEFLDLIVPGGHSHTEAMSTALETFLKAYPDRKDQVSIALIALLERENVIVANAAVGSLSEEFGNYLGDLIGATAALRDSRAIDALIAELRTGNMASRAVAELGPQALDRVVGLLNTGDIASRIGAAHTLGQMLNPATVKLDVAARTKAKVALLRASKDSFFAVRESAISGLTRLPDADVMAALRAIANTDPYSRVDEVTGNRTYPVRDAARRALASR
jgi:hypothetical protein